MERGERRSSLLSRREWMAAGGIGLLGAGVAIGCGIPSTGQDRDPSIRPGDARVTTRGGGAKPVYVAPEGVEDPLSLSVADTLFWLDALVEHAQFFVLLMPGPELADARAEAQRYRQTLFLHFERARFAQLRQGEAASFNRGTIELVRPFIDFQLRMRDAQASGKLRSLAWPSFFEHAAREAQHFTARLTAYARGDGATRRSEVVDFWGRDMADHAGFIAHLLDPEEAALVEQARRFADGFRELETRGSAPGEADPVHRAAMEILDFKTVLARGVGAGMIKSILYPALADHFRREALRFVEDLKRAR